MTKPSREIAIVGGGIAGLYCALVLKHQNYDVTIYERTGRWGGRIRTIRLDRNSNELGSEEQLELDTSNPSKGWDENSLEFYAEFGPMRIELDKQPLLKALLQRLHIPTEVEYRQKTVGSTSEAVTLPEQNQAGIDPKSRTSISGKKLHAHLVDFPSYSSPSSLHDPTYPLEPEEQNKTPLQLFQLALLRVMCEIETTTDADSPYMQMKEKLEHRLAIAGGTYRSSESVFESWVKELNEDHLWEIQTKGFIRRKWGDGREVHVKLYAMGFWNLLDDYLSHNAILKIRDLGTFYHLLPENPNAAEWLVWWLRGFAISETLQGIYGGMECIVDYLRHELLHGVAHGKANNGTVTFKLNHSLKRIAITDPQQGETPALDLHFDVGEAGTTTSRVRSHSKVILALPKSPIEQILGASAQLFEKQSVFQTREDNVNDLLDCAFGFPLLKTFVVVKRRWWNEDNLANRYAHDIPTRELHYWKGKDVARKQGMIMVYTDRPASSFWANYAPPGAQEDVFRTLPKMPASAADVDDGEIVDGSEHESPPTEREILDGRLKEKCANYIARASGTNFRSSDIVWSGIRDWSREPYGGANHAWRPERKFWVVMRRLADIGTHSNTPPANVCRLMICGEAYSDYHGFIEGPLRSASYVLHRLLDVGKTSPHNLKWLTEVFPAMRTDELCKEYFKTLQTWAKNLDQCGIDDPYRWNPESD
jgi:hypothetical protein